MEDASLPKGSHESHQDSGTPPSLNAFFDLPVNVIEQ
jgi:hypothetical protein